jgi:hypothetical protein
VAYDRGWLYVIRHGNGAAAQPLMALGFLVVSLSFWSAAGAVAPDLSESRRGNSCEADTDPGRAGGGLVGVGLLIVSVGFSVGFWAIEYDSPGVLRSKAFMTYGLAVVLGYGLMAWASWWWIRTLSRSPGSTRAMTLPLRVLALASLVFATAYFVSEIDDLRDLSGPGGSVGAGAGLSLCIGFVVASVGFWTAARMADTPSPMSGVRGDGHALMPAREP